MRSHHASRAPKRRSRTAARALALLCSVGIAAALGPVIASVPDSFGDPPAACAAPADALAGVWRPARLEVLATCRLVTGVVRGVHRQVDGDLTFELLPDRPYRALANRVNRRKLRGALYVELPPRDGGHLYAPSRGDHVTLEGALVTDRGERWNELHPVFAEQIGRGPTFRSGPQFGGSPPSANAFGAAERCRDASAHRCEGFTGAFGQCLPATSGAYSDGACTAPAPGGRYEWHPAPEALASLAGAAFTTSLAPRTIARLTQAWPPWVIWARTWVAESPVRKVSVWMTTGPGSGERRKCALAAMTWSWASVHVAARPSIASR